MNIAHELSLSRLQWDYHECGREIRKKKEIKLNVAAWNAQTMLDSEHLQRPERRSVPIDKKRLRNDVDVAGHSKTRLLVDYLNMDLDVQSFGKEN